MVRPYALLAELTHRCPLHCTYCSNPVEGVQRAFELPTSTWLSLIDEARELGVLQLHLSGGEPVLHRGLVEIVQHASDMGMYVSLVTSGVGRFEELCGPLAAAGLDHVQLSLQDVDPQRAFAVAGARVIGLKRRAAKSVIANGLALSINVVLHRGNIDAVLPLAHLAAELGADRLELAHTQYYGWALLNRDSLKPTRRQVAQAAETVGTIRTDPRTRHLQILYVDADYHSGRPKACGHGWGARHIIVAPDGAVLPCVAARSIAELEFPIYEPSRLADIWHSSPAFNAFRGLDWMGEPCRSCVRREIDLGGCRCQAYMLTGDASRTDPVCDLSPDHQIVLDALAREPTPAIRRTNPRAIAAPS